MKQHTLPILRLYKAESKQRFVRQGMFSVSLCITPPRLEVFLLNPLAECLPRSLSCHLPKRKSKHKGTNKKDGMKIVKLAEKAKV